MSREPGARRPGALRRRPRRGAADSRPGEAVRRTRDPRAAPVGSGGRETRSGSSRRLSRQEPHPRWEFAVERHDSPSGGLTGEVRENAVSEDPSHRRLGARGPGPGPGRHGAEDDLEPCSSRRRSERAEQDRREGRRGPRHPAGDTPAASHDCLPVESAAMGARVDAPRSCRVSKSSDSKFERSGRRRRFSTIGPSRYDEAAAASSKQ